MHQYDVSIVTPSYNQGKFIAETFDSILRQEHKKFSLQYIIVDALSTDETDAVVKKYLPKFKKQNIDVIYIREKDHGQSDAINKGWKKAKGKIVSYLNSDDYYEQNTLHKVVEYFKTHKTVDWVYGGWNVVNRSGAVFQSFQHERCNSFQLRSYASNIGQPSCFFRKTLLKKVGGEVNEHLHLAMDYDLWLRFLKISPPTVLPFIIANLRYYGGAKSAQFMTKHNWQAYQVALTHSNQNLGVVLYATIRFILGWLSIQFGRNISQTIEKS